MPKVLVCSTEMSQITFRRRVSGYLKSAAWLFVIFVSDSLWSSFLLTILVWKIVLQFVRSNRQIFILTCISYHPYHKRRLRMLKLKKKTNKQKTKTKTKTNKQKEEKTYMQSHWMTRHFSIAFSPWGLIVISNISLKNVQKLLPFSLLCYLLHKNPNDNYF